MELKLRGDFTDVLGAFPNLASQQRARRAVRRLEISAVLGNGALSRTGSFTETTRNSGTGPGASGSPRKLNSSTSSTNSSSNGISSPVSSTLVVGGNSLSKGRSFTGYEGGVRSSVAFSADALEELACGASLVYSARGGGVDEHACAAHVARPVHYGNCDVTGYRGSSTVPCHAS